jgi:hypothetical protein
VPARTPSATPPSFSSSRLPPSPAYPISAERSWPQRRRRKACRCFEVDVGILVLGGRCGTIGLEEQSSKCDPAVILVFATASEPGVPDLGGTLLAARVPAAAAPDASPRHRERCWHHELLVLLLLIRRAVQNTAQDRDFSAEDDEERAPAGLTKLEETAANGGQAP